MAGITDTTSFSGQTGATRTNLIDLQAQEGLFFKKNWNVVGLEDFLHSSQQSLDLRTTLGGGVGRYLFRTNWTFLALIGGTVYTRENFTPNIQLESDQNIEGLAGYRVSTPPSIDIRWYPRRWSFPDSRIWAVFVPLRN